ncbi:solute carrier family 49 member 4 homolog isoform X3 [Ruditapes philippinarum]|uniref:solute carrier family 49 member 4 homolog isoform X3 n=1 Tax=Ruditapes philippinarum TaxID=129788 RepID=UPI00295B6DF3|nr:solute carrier family 49 member 4 homolog isoform X3 [Ruditapes philippinarum]
MARVQRNATDSEKSLSTYDEETEDEKSKDKNVQVICEHNEEKSLDETFTTGQHRNLNNTTENTSDIGSIVNKTIESVNDKETDLYGEVAKEKSLSDEVGPTKNVGAIALSLMVKGDTLNDPLEVAAEEDVDILEASQKKEKEMQKEKFDLSMAEKEPLLTSGRHSGRRSAFRDLHDEDSDVNVVYSRPGSAIDANINVTYHDSSSDYHDYSTRIDGGRANENGPCLDGSIILYKRRWYILMILSLCVTLQNAVWGTWGPIAESAKFVYGWDTTMVFIIINCGNIGVLLPALFTGHVISSKGLRVSMISCSFLLALGAGLRTISKHKTVGTILIGAGQFCNGLAGSITQVIPAALSEAWFPVHERATATAIGVISNSLGSIVSFMLGPNLVNEPNSDNTITSNASFLYTDISNTTNGNDTRSQETETISRQIWILTMIEFCAGGFLFILTIAYFPAQPPSPPSRSAREKRINFTQGLCSVIRQPLILLAAMSCAVPWAVYGNWMALLNVNLHEIGISQSQSGLFGFYASIAGIIGGIAIGRIADRFQRRLKKFVMLVFFLALILIIWITCMRLSYLPKSIGN